MAASKKPGARSGRLRNIQIRLNAAEATRVEGDLKHFQGISVVKVGPGTYAKAAVLAFPRFLKMEATLRALAKDVRDNKVAASINRLLATEPPA